MKTIIHFTGDLLVECKNPDDVLHPAIDYLERAALDGCPVLLVHTSINDKLHPTSKRFQHEEPCPCIGVRGHEYTVTVVLAGGQEDRDRLMFNRYAFQVEYQYRLYRAELFLHGAIVYAPEGDRVQLAHLGDLKCCPFPGQAKLFD